MRDEIYRSDTLRVIRTLAGLANSHAQGCDLITFEPLAHVTGRSPFGMSFAEKYKINALHVIPIANDWYQHKDLPACLAAVARYAAPSATIYGSSMGGFAATTYADALPHSKIIALSPQFTIRPELVPFEKRWVEEAARIEFLPGDDRVAQASPRYVLFNLFDPRSPDAQHARLIAERGNVILVKVPGGGHPVGPVLVEAGCLSELILSIMHGEPTAVELKQLILEEVPRSPMHHFILAMQSPLREREERLRRGLNLDPNHSRLRHEYGLYLAAT